MTLSQIDPWVALAIELVPLLNWLTIVLGAYLLGRFLSSTRLELVALRKTLEATGRLPAETPVTVDTATLTTTTTTTRPTEEK